MTTPVDNSLVETVKVLNRGNGNLLIYTTDAIQSVGIYTLAGQLIFAADNINANQFATTLPPHNVYIFDIVTTQTVSKQKIVVK